MEFNPYDVLGVPHDASDATIKAAYRALAQKMHPDKNPKDSQATAKFQRLQQAFEILSDPVRRRAFDTTGETTQDEETARSKRPIEDRARDIISIMLAHMLEAIAEGGITDFVTDLRNGLRNGKGTADHQLMLWQKRARNLETAIKRYRFKGKGDDLMVGALKQRLLFSQKHVDFCVKAVEEFESAIQLLDAGYEPVYEEEARYAAPARSSFLSFTGGWDQT